MFYRTRVNIKKLLEYYNQSMKLLEQLGVELGIANSLIILEMYMEKKENMKKHLIICFNQCNDEAYWL
jgi:hypothetical protein